MQWLRRKLCTCLSGFADQLHIVLRCVIRNNALDIVVDAIEPDSIHSRAHFLCLRRLPNRYLDTLYLSGDSGVCLLRCRALCIADRHRSPEGERLLPLSLVISDRIFFDMVFKDGDSLLQFPDLHQTMHSLCATHSALRVSVSA